MAAKKGEETQAPRVPVLGEPVHFVHGAEHVPAIVTAPSITVIDARTKQPVERTALTVFPVSMPSFTDVADYDADGKPGTWHWPETVEAEPAKSE